MARLEAIENMGTLRSCWVFHAQVVSEGHAYLSLGRHWPSSCTSDSHKAQCSETRRPERNRGRRIPLLREVVQNVNWALIWTARGEASPPRNEPKMLVGGPTVRTTLRTRGWKHHHRLIEVGMVEQVEGLGPDLKVRAFPWSIPQSRRPTTFESGGRFKIS